MDKIRQVFGVLPFARAHRRRHMVGSRFVGRSRALGLHYLRRGKCLVVHTSGTHQAREWCVCRRVAQGPLRMLAEFAPSLECQRHSVDNLDGFPISVAPVIIHRHALSPLFSTVEYYESLHVATSCADHLRIAAMQSNQSRPISEGV